jgi:indolepyruvate ferredoxin oxidoreductase
MTFHLAPPMLPGRDVSGRPKKRSFGPWILTVFKLLARLKRLRGTALDIFGYLPERRTERQLIAEYRELIDGIADRVNQHNLAVAIELARAAAEIGGYGPVKDASIARYKLRLTELLELFDTKLAVEKYQTPYPVKGF